MVKPQFFEYLEKEKEAWAAVHDVRNWVVRKTSAHVRTTYCLWNEDVYFLSTQDDDGWRMGACSASEIALEFGGVLKAFDSCRQLGARPRSHQNFSRMVFQEKSAASRSQHLGEDELNLVDENSRDPGDIGSKGDSAGEVNGGWLENDDIEEF